MANEIHVDTDRNLTLYACRFQPDGDVFLTNGASDEVWGTGGRDADDYDVTMTETAANASGHYVGTFDDGTIAAGTYKVAVYIQGGANPADTDDVFAQGEIIWDGSAEVPIASQDDVTGAHVTTDALITAQVAAQHTIYDET